MIAEVVALLMFIGPDIKEHRIQPEGMAQCLRHKRIAERQFTPNVQYKCLRSKAELEDNIPDWKVQTSEWNVENTSKWKTEDTDNFFYEIEEKKHEEK